METQEKILAKLQGLEKQVDILTQLLIALINSRLYRGWDSQRFSLIYELDKMASKKSDLINVNESSRYVELIQK